MGWRSWWHRERDKEELVRIVAAALAMMEKMPETTTHWCGPISLGPVQTVAGKVLARIEARSVEACRRELRAIVQAEVANEAFIDKIVDRIMRKQLGAGGKAHE